MSTLNEFKENGVVLKKKLLLQVLYILAAVLYCK